MSRPIQEIQRMVYRTPTGTDPTSHLDFAFQAGIRVGLRIWRIWPPVARRIEWFLNIP